MTVPSANPIKISPSPAKVIDSQSSAAIPVCIADDVVRIRPGTGWRALDLRELWRYRELLGFLAARDISVRYKQTVLGVAWAVLQPLCTMVVFTIFFGRLAKMPSDGIPYPIFALVGLLPWQLFAYALQQSSNSLVNEQRLISKVYFPRLVIPLSSVLAGAADFAIAFGLVGLMMVGYAAAGFPPRITVAVAMLPVFTLLALAAALGVGLWLAALNVQYRDVRYVVPFLTQLWLFLTPIAYPSSLVPQGWRILYGINPMTGVVDGFRWALVGGPAPDPGLMAASVAVVVALLIGGLFYFRRVEAQFADVV
ncbi:ABC transporter permease [Humisphaera borealis]|uniref:Transport permease protein n=1 Tax=Humisphaera borealis TaxID=2807512 RepID=A0A7M2WZM2_9BACT|nr:ABC transporter permease [Humisphaera borealis]QOV90642.1 ABC transporter permease [Humisphaera borealis]